VSLVKSLYPEFKANQFSNLQKKFETLLSSSSAGFFSDALDLSVAQKCFESGKKWSHQRNHLFHIGIGGSALGPEMLVYSLLPHKKNISFINNIDPDDFSLKINSVDLRECLFFVVSKSGTTAETMAGLAIVINKLTSLGIPESHWKEYLVFATDPEKGELRQFANDYNIQCFDIPPRVGGRYSVLTPVGLFPFSFLGGNPTHLIEGALEYKSYLMEDNDLFNLATFLFERSQKGESQTVLMPYSSLLKEFSSWFVQLWAESLGKNKKGLTPIPAYGATDQHSQVQLFMEGPKDKVILFIEILKHKENFALDCPLKLSQIQRLKNFTLKDLLSAELKGTMEAFKTVERSYCHLQLEEITAANMGKLILFFESLTVLVGLLFEIDPFNQPGVELGKQKAWEILER
jgi:glucose-6-phosphate isomerase